MLGVLKLKKLLLVMPATSTARERLFSTMQHIHET